MKDNILTCTVMPGEMIPTIYEGRKLIHVAPGLVEDQLIYYVYYAKEGSSIEDLQKM